MLVEVNDEDIAYAEKILFGKTGEFDSERIDFIKNLSTSLDLQAVPGSGKTTVLLAKLLILERYLPFGDDSGILVLSHTNTAVNEIKDRIGRYCPRLFSHPNFVGTIQSFTDEFLAIPYYVNCFKKRPVKVDQDIYLERFNWKYPYNLRVGLERALSGRYVQFVSEMTVNKQRQLIHFNSLESLSIGRVSNTRPMHSKLIETKLDLIKDGFLNYNDAYYLARRYLEVNPRIISILRKRFKMVFVDEMQDMESHQYNLLETLFFCEGVVYQRIGDKNQAVYGDSSDDQNIWQDRETTLPLKGSYRLPSNIADIVNNFCIDPSFKIEGRGQDVHIKPCIIVFTDSSISKVLPNFTRIITEKIPSDVILKNRHKIKMIGWRKQQKDQNRLGINSYFINYNPEIQRDQSLLPSLIQHLAHSSVSGPSLDRIRKSILEAFITILRLEGVKIQDRHFIGKTLLRFLKEEYDSDFYEEFKLSIYKWSKAIYLGETESVYTEICTFIPSFLGIFDCRIDKSREFIDRRGTDLESDEFKDDNIHVCSETGLRVEVGTVHSVKGETHLATLYVETFYRSKHESDRLPNGFCGVAVNCTGKWDKETAKMAYVAMSRPTHLLCFAMHANRYRPLKGRLQMWEVVELS